MMTLLGKTDGTPSVGHMRGLIFKDNAELAMTTGEHETMTFEVRQARDGIVELHVRHAIQGKKRQRVNSRHMIHSYSPEAFAELKALINSVG